MIKSEIVIVDYGVGNLLSVQRAVERVGSNAVLTSDPETILNARHVILPGVGAFANAMQALNYRGLTSVLKDVAQRDIPFLGICLGMQLLFDESEEFGSSKGLGIIRGRVVPIPAIADDGRTLKIPHIGWNELMEPENSSWNETILDGLPSKSSVYFVHSYMAVANDPSVRLAICNYGGNHITAAVQSRNVLGCQFHPEKSGNYGLEILKNFLFRSRTP